MKILALDLSTTRASLAWSENEAEVVREWRNDRKNSGCFFEQLHGITKDFGLPDNIVVGLGPGSYAGVRIAIAAAIGMQTAAQADLLGYPSICAMATDADDYVVVGDARRRSFYYARICQRKVADSIQLYDEIRLREKLNNMDSNVPVFSSDMMAQFSSVQLCHPSAAILARLARRDQAGFSRAPLEPIYLREPHITTPKDQLLRR